NRSIGAKEICPLFCRKFTSFLIPFATRGMVAEIRDSEHPHLAGNYFISEVKTTFGMGGARRIVKISNKL
ncbi:MAG: hypothetical protein WCJ72_12365, partial [Chryseobacterium sp.]